MNRLLPYIPLSKPLRGADAAHQFDADVFERHGSLNAYVRLVVEGEYADAPAAIRHMLAQPLQGPFRFLTLVQRAAVSLFEHRREPIQVRAIGFDPSRDGILQNGFLRNEADRPATRTNVEGCSLPIVLCPAEVTHR